MSELARDWRWILVGVAAVGLLGWGGLRVFRPPYPSPWYYPFGPVHFDGRLYTVTRTTVYWVGPEIGEIGSPYMFPPKGVAEAGWPIFSIRGVAITQEIAIGTKEGFMVARVRHGP